MKVCFLFEKYTQVTDVVWIAAINKNVRNESRTFAKVPPLNRPRKIKRNE
jgi:hypothetical protein